MSRAAKVGFVTVERRLWDHAIFASSPMTEREAWIWMIAKASWAGTQHLVGSNLIDVERGSFMATLRELQSTFVWGSDKRVRNYLKKLEKSGMLTVVTLGERNSRKTHVTICNYDEYQAGGRTKDAPETHDGRTTDAVKNKVTIKQGNNLEGAGTPDPKKTEHQEVLGILSEYATVEASKEFMSYRTNIKKSKLTVTAAQRVAAQLSKIVTAGGCADDALGLCQEHGWQAIKSDWYFNAKNQTPRNNQRLPASQIDTAAVNNAAAHGSRLPWEADA